MVPVVVTLICPCGPAELRSAPGWRTRLAALIVLVPPAASSSPAPVRTRPRVPKSSVEPGLTATAVATTHGPGGGDDARQGMSLTVVASAARGTAQARRRTATS